MKKMKKWLSLLFMVGMLLTLSACEAEDVYEISQGIREINNTLQGVQQIVENTQDLVDTVQSSELGQQVTDAAQELTDSLQEKLPDGTDTALPDLDRNGVYTSKEDVALYLHLYGELPGNFITKKEAEKLGWPGGHLEPYAPGKCIGGDRFGNYEGLLPETAGRTYTECDIDTLGAQKRGAKRIVFSNDGLIYYTEDHYASFELLYGEE